MNDALTRRDLRNGSSPDASTQTPSILMVCTGNICRSPMAEVLLRARLGTLEVRVHSAGTRALVDARMARRARRLAVTHGASPKDVAAHRARWLTDSMLNDADLVLGMARRHGTETIELSPGLRNQAFTAREFARLADAVSDAQIREASEAGGDDPRARLTAAAALLATQRDLADPVTSTEDDIIDPYKRSTRAYNESAAQLVPVIDNVTRVLRVALGRGRNHCESGGS